MPESPASPTPYEVLGVAATAGSAELRRAYRKLLRQTHPDTGGDPGRFLAVQQAWERIGDAEARAAWDSGVHAAGTSAPGSSPTARSGANPNGSTVRARTYGHPGGQSREHFLSLMREWAGRGSDIDPYDPSLVRSAPRELRRLLASALAEEATARVVAGLGIGFTMWSDVATDRGKLDHVVLGPAGVFAVASEDWGAPVKLVRGELEGVGFDAGERPIRELTRKTKSLGREVGVRFTSTILVVPDDALTERVAFAGKGGGVAVVTLSALASVLRNGPSEGTGARSSSGQRLSIEDVFDVRSRLQQHIRLV